MQLKKFDKGNFITYHATKCHDAMRCIILHDDKALRLSHGFTSWVITNPTPIKESRPKIPNNLRRGKGIPLAKSI